mgnify:FL=1
MLKRKMIEMLFEKHEGAKWLTFLSLPALHIAGWLIYICWTIGLSGWWSPALSICTLSICVVLLVKNTTWEKSDLRWLIAPALILLLSWYIPWWDYHHQRFDTGGYLHMALEFMGKYNNAYTAYRSPIISGIISMEFFVTGETYTTYWSVLILFISTIWQFQHLAERWTTKTRASICIAVIILLPVMRYWGQMAMTDVASAGMWICTLHLLLISEHNNNNRLISIILGIAAGMTFLSKQTHIYLIGIVGWAIIKDRNFPRGKDVLIGWLIVVSPYMVDCYFRRGHPFAPLLGQTDFAVKSMTGTYDSYTTTTFLNEISFEIPLILFLGSAIGLYLLFLKNKKDFITVFVMLTPLILLNGIILDWGEPRYNTPIFALIVILSIVSIMDNDAITFNKIDDGKIKSMLSIFTVSIVIFTGAFHSLTLPEDSIKAHEYNDNMELWTNFEVVPLDELEEGDLLLAGRGTSVGLMTGIHTYRYEPRYYACNCSDDLILNSILLFSPTHALTTNVGPYFQWEKDFDWQLGHGSIELETIHTDGWWSAALWRVDDTTYLSPDEYYSNYTGNVTGDLLILGPNESFTVGDSNLSIKWIEVTTIRPYQQVMKILAGEEGLMRNGSLDGGEVSFFNSHEQLISPPDKYTYAWIESTK